MHALSLVEAALFSCLAFSVGGCSGHAVFTPNKVRVFTPYPKTKVVFRSYKYKTPKIKIYKPKKTTIIKRKAKNRVISYKFKYPKKSQSIPKVFHKPRPTKIKLYQSHQKTYRHHSQKRK